MESILRVGLVGIGGYGQQHLSVLRTLEQFDLCRLLAVADPFIARHEGTVQALASEGVTASTDPHGLLQRDDLDAVFISSPIHLHAPQTVMALETGKHVYIEKPPCATLAEFERMKAARAASGKFCAVGFQMQTSPAMRFLKERLLQGAIGTLQQVRAVVRWSRNTQYYNRTPWAGRWRIETEDGAQPVFDGPATNALAHVVHGALFLAGPSFADWPTLKRVRGSLKKANPIESYDSAYLEAETSEDVRVQLALTHATSITDEAIIYCEGSVGTAEVRWDGTVVITPHGGAAQTFFFAFNPAFAAPLDFLRALQPGAGASAAPHSTNGQLVTRLEDTLSFVQITNGALQSSGGAPAFASGIEAIGAETATSFYQVSGLDEQLDAFRNDGTTLPPLFDIERAPWIAPNDLETGWLPAPGVI